MSLVHALDIDREITSGTELPVGASRPTVFADARELARRGFERVRWMPGNVGYVVIRSLEPVGEARHAALAALGMLCQTRAMIIDLREAGGGDRAMAALIASHFFDTESACADESYLRPGSRLPAAMAAPRTRYAAREVYVLVGPRTSGAAEDLARNLQALGRATVVGAMTESGFRPDIIAASAVALELAHNTALRLLALRDAA
ncbi:MAG: S41 family peptidase [Gemmatimonadota bacterium]|nr:S41 family peptidase [Gemmatimonadota bacterium]